MTNTHNTNTNTHNTNESKSILDMGNVPMSIGVAQLVVALLSEAGTRASIALNDYIWLNHIFPKVEDRRFLMKIYYTWKRTPEQYNKDETYEVFHAGELSHFLSYMLNCFIEENCTQEEKEEELEIPTI